MLGLSLLLTACVSGGSGTAAKEFDFPSHLWTDPGLGVAFNAAKAKMLADNSGLKFDAAEIPFTNYFQKEYTDMVSGRAPDMVTPYDPQLPQWVRQGLLEPLDPYLSAAGIDVAKATKTQQLASIGGHVYGIMVASNPRVLVYNKALLDQAGVRPPTNLDELKAAIAQLHDPAKQQFGFATLTGSDSPDATYLELMPIVAGFGGAFVRGGKPVADSPETVAALDFLKQQTDKGLIPKAMTQANYRDAFIAGKVAMTAIGGFIIGQATAKNPPVGQALLATPLPLPGTTISVNVFVAVPKAAKHKDLAIKFIQELLQSDIQGKVVTNGVAVPFDAQYVPAGLTQDRPWFQAILDAAKTAQSYAPQGAEEKAPQVAKIVTDNYQALLTTNETAQQAAAKMQQELAQLLA
jgi:ABC-type glycerol-3-phosphate transport system substrate-binding protein